jgi:hypothetical protein
MMATTAAVMIVGVLAVGTPMLLRGTGAAPVADRAVPRLDANNCPTTWVDTSHHVDRPGPLVPVGAVAITLCELPVDPAKNAAPTPAPAPRTVTLRVEELVAALNELPNQEQATQRLGHPVGIRCPAIFLPQLSLVAIYANGDPVTVTLDRSCGTATAEGRTRFLSGGSSLQHPYLVDGFVALYREQLAAATDPATITVPACAAMLSEQDLSMSHTDNQPRDAIARNRGGVDAFAPSALIEIRACRYHATAGILQLVKQHHQRDDLVSVRDLLNDATLVGTEAATNLSECALESAIDSLDVVWLADATGAISEIRVPRARCAEVRRAGIGGLVLRPGFAERLDGWLG